MKLIDLVTARLDAKNDCFVAELAQPAAQRCPHRRRPGPHARADAHGRLLRRGGSRVRPDHRRGEERAALSASSPCARSSSRSATCWTPCAKGRSLFTFKEWKDFLLRSVGLEPSVLGRAHVRRHAAAHGPVRREQLQPGRARPARHRQEPPFQQVSPYAHLVSGGKATVARMFVNNATGQRGLVCQYDVVCFDEVSGVSFDQKDGVNIMKGYMESGEFSRGKESIRGVRRHRHGRQLRRRCRAPAAHRSPVRAAAARDARRHGLHGPHPLPTFPAGTCPKSAASS